MTKLSLDILAIWWLFSGTFYAIYFLTVLQYKDEFKELVRDLVWNSGFNDEFFYWVSLFISFSFGFIFLPKRVLKWLGIIGSKK